MRESVRAVLHSGHILPYLHYGLVLQYLLGSQDQSSRTASTVSLFFAYWFRCMRTQSVYVAVSTSSSVESLLGLLMEDSSSGTKTDWPVEHKSSGIRSPKGNSEWYLSHFHLSIPGPLNPGCGRNTTICGMLTQHIWPSRRTLSQHCKVPPASCDVTEPSKGHSLHQSIKPVTSGLFLRH